MMSIYVRSIRWTFRHVLGCSFDLCSHVSSVNSVAMVQVLRIPAADWFSETFRRTRGERENHASCAYPTATTTQGMGQSAQAPRVFFLKVRVRQPLAFRFVLTALACPSPHPFHPSVRPAFRGRAAVRPRYDHSHHTCHTGLPFYAYSARLPLSTLSLARRQ